MRKFYVYTLSDMLDEVFYVGKGSMTEKYDRLDFHTKYWKYHQHSNKRLFNKIKKLNGQFVVKIVFESDDEMCCFEVEKIKIAEIRCAGGNLCNLTDGGEGVSGWRHSTEAKTKMSLNRDINISKKNIQKAAEANTGKRKADRFDIEKLYETNSIYQIKALTGLTFNTIKKYLVEKGLYIKNKNRQSISDDGRTSMGKGQKARTDRKKVNQYDTEGNFVQSWNCAQKAVDAYGFCVRDCLRGRQKTAYGYIWKYDEKTL